MEILGIVVSLLGLMYFAYRGINVLVLAGRIPDFPEQCSV